MKGWRCPSFIFVSSVSRTPSGGWFGSDGALALAEGLRRAGDEGLLSGALVASWFVCLSNEIWSGVSR